MMSKLPYETECNIITKEGVKRYLNIDTLTKDQKDRLKALSFIDEIRKKNGRFCSIELKGKKMKHYLKIKRCYLRHILEKTKTFEIRRNYRDYQVGDTIRFMPEQDDNYDDYNKDVISEYEITYVHSGLGMLEEYVVLGIIEKKEDNSK